MLALLHVSIALSSIFYMAYVLWRPSKPKMAGAGSLVALTVTSGVFLVIETRTPLMNVCTIGLIYIGGMAAALLLTYYRIVHKQNLDQSE